MPEIPIIMPQLGESIAEAIVVNYLVKEGETVQTGQDVVEVETNKANMNVTAPCRGKVERFLAKKGESFPVGAVLGYLEVTHEDAMHAGLDETPSANATAEPNPGATG